MATWASSTPVDNVRLGGARRGDESPMSGDISPMRGGGNVYARPRPMGSQGVASEYPMSVPPSQAAVGVSTASYSPQSFVPPSPMQPTRGAPSAETGYAAEMNHMSHFGTWNELIAGGIVDRSYIEQEAERRKQEIDRALDSQLSQIEAQSQEQVTNVEQQAEYHTKMAEQQIETHKKQHLAHVTRQAEIQAYSIIQRAEMEKGRLGQEACRALSQQSEKEKAAVVHDAMRKAEEAWRQSQRALLEQAQRAKVEIDTQAQRRTADIEREVRQAISRVYISPQSPLAPIGAPSFGSFVPAPAM